MQRFFRQANRNLFKYIEINPLNVSKILVEVVLNMLSHLRIHLRSSFFSTTWRPPSGLKVPKMKSMGPIWVYGFEISLIGVGFEGERVFSRMPPSLNTIKQFRKIETETLLIRFLREMVIFDHTVWSIQVQSAFKFEVTLGFTPLNPSKVHFGRFFPKRYQYTDHFFPQSLG